MLQAVYRLQVAHTKDCYQPTYAPKKRCNMALPHRPGCVHEQALQRRNAIHATHDPLFDISNVKKAADSYKGLGNGAVAAVQHQRPVPANGRQRAVLEERHHLYADQSMCWSIFRFCARPEYSTHDYG